MQRALRMLLLLALIGCSAASLHAQTTYTWTGAAGSAWNNAANWSPNTGFPLTADHATIVNTANSPVLDANRSVANLVVSSGALDLAGRTLTFTGNGTFSGGAVDNGTLAANNTGGTVIFSGTTFGANLSGTASALLFNGSVFNGTVTLTKTGTSNDLCTGGSTFNNAVTLTTTAGRLYLDNTGIDLFNGNLVLNSTATGGGFWFGQTSGSATLAAGRTIAVGSGFSIGSLVLRNFTQSGTTPQVLALTGTATAYYQVGTSFGGDLQSTSPGLYLNGATFGGTAKFTKTGLNNEYSSGGNVFTGNTELVVTGPGTLYLNNTGNDQFNGNLVLNSTGTGGMRFGQTSGTSVLAAGGTLSIGGSGYSAGPLGLRGFTQSGSSTTLLNLSSTAVLTFDAGTVLNGNIVASAPSVFLQASTFNGNARFTKTANTDDWSTGGCVFNGNLELTNNTSGVFCLDNTGSDQFNGNIVVNNTSTGSIRFGNSAGSTAVLAAGKTLSVGASGFNSGQLALRNFTQQGGSAQVLALGTGASTYLIGGNAFGGNLTVTCGAITINGSTFNGAAKFNKTGTTLETCSGGNTFNSTAEFNISGTGSLFMAEGGTDTYNGDILVTNTSNGQLRFGSNGAGQSNLSSGHALAVGPAGFNNGILLLRNFTQAGSTPQTLALGTAATLYFHSGSTFNGAVTSTSGGLFFNGTTFNATGKFTKTGATNEGSAGGNTFNARAEFINTNTGALQLADAGADAYNGDLVVNNTSTGLIRFGQGGGTSTLAAGRTIAVGSLGFNAGQLSLRYFTQQGSTPQNLVLGTGAQLIYHLGSTFNGPVTSTSGTLLFQGTTFNADGKFTKTGPVGDGCLGGNVFNGRAEFINSGTGILQLADGGTDNYNGDIVVNNTSTSGIRFGQGGGSSILAAGRTISIGTLGFNTGQLSLRYFTQQGSTPQNLVLGTGAQLIYHLGSTFNGPVTSTSGSLFFMGCTFNADGSFTKTGTSGDASAGGNTFNGRTELTMTAAGNLQLGDAGTDNYNGDIVVNSTSTGQIRFGQGGGYSNLAAGRTISVGALGFPSGMLLLRNFTQAGGTAQTLSLGPAAQLYFHSGSTFNGAVTSTSGNLYFFGTTFNSTGKFTKTGTSSDVSGGGDVFNSTAEFILTAAGNLSLHYTGVDQFNGDVLVNSTSTGQINFGQSTGSATLATGRTISVGALGFATGTLAFRSFTQVGPTAQNLVLGTAATLRIDPGCTFNGDLTSTSGAFFVSGSTFNGNCRFTKTGNSADNSNGGNVFNGNTELLLTSVGNLSMDCYTGTDRFNGNLVVNNTSTGQISFGLASGAAILAAGRTISVGASLFNSGVLLLRNFTQVGTTPQNLVLGTPATLRYEIGTVFNGDLTSTSGVLFINSSTFNGTSKFTKTGTSGDNSNGGNVFNGTAEFVLTSTGTLNLDCYTGTDQFNGDVVLNNTSTGQIGFGVSGGYAVLAAGRTMSVGALAFNAGTLLLRNFTQLGSTPQNLVLGNAAVLRFESGNVFNGPATSTSGGLFFNGTTFNSNGRFTKTGSSNDNSNGGNVFNGTAELISTGTGILGMDCYTGTDLFNGDLLVNSTSTGQINFGTVSGSATLAAGRTMAVGGTGFASGTLTLRNFRQIGATSQNLLMTGTSSLTFLTGTVIDGAITTTSANLLLSGATFNGNALFTKSGPSNNASAGGNVFNGDAEIRIPGGPFTMANSAADDFNGNATFIRTGAGTVTICNTFNTTFSKDVSTAGSTGTILFGAGAGRTIFDGAGLQRFSSDAAYPPQVRNLTVNKASGTLDLLGDVVVTTDMAFTSGVIRPQAATSTGNGLLIINSGVTFSDAADAGSYVDGFMRKIGNTAFSFPVGNAGKLAPIAMSALGGAVTQHFTAKYVYQDPDVLYDDQSHDPSIHHISGCEYWILDRTNGSANVSVTLSYDSVRSCGVTNLTDLVVARWNGTTWKDHGNGGTTGTLAVGTVMSVAPVTSFSPFTLASRSISNPLPIELLSFTAVGEGSVVRTEWVTATERNNARFEVERGVDGDAFERVGTLPGAGDSQQELHYAFVDEAPLRGLSYYRLKQVDLDGAFTYSDVVPVYRGDLSAEGVRLFPNPATDQATVAIEGATEGHLDVLVLNAQGQVVLDASQVIPAGDAAVRLSLDGFPAGVYLVRVQQEGGALTELRLVKQ